MNRRRKGYEHRKGVATPKFIMVRFDLFDSEAMRKLSTTARALYLELKRRYNGANNGRIGLGCREAAKALNVGTNTAALAFKHLRHVGLVEPVMPAELTSTGRKATEWLLTEHPDDVHGTGALDSWRGPKNIPPVAEVGHSVLPERRNAPKPRSKSTLRPTSETQQPVSPQFASYGSDTYTSSHTKSANERAAQSAPKSEASGARSHEPPPEAPSSAYPLVGTIKLGLASGTALPEEPQAPKRYPRKTNQLIADGVKRPAAQ